ncbi:MAG: hypothetical protein HY904_19800 [Deltaproteobacteria bacterium]|nr:hypothetical protein [Deltaproteobacteria bacterium]
MDVHLLGGRPLYFPFLSGILDYDCPSCDARCCKGASLGIGRSRELAALLHINPAMALLAGDAFPAGALPTLDTVMEQCWFLDAQNLCRLEKNAGREKKPAGCRLYPFNQFRLADPFVVVMPHFHCPLRVTDEPASHGRNSHDELALEMHVVGVPRDGHPPLAVLPDMAWTDVIPLERTVRDLGAAHLRATDYAPYADLQADQTSRALGLPRGVRCTTLRRRVAGFLGYGEGWATPPLVRDLVALTPYLRLRVASVPRQQVPQVLTALGVLSGIVEAMPGTRMTARTVVQLMERRMGLLVALSHLLDKPRLSEGHDAEPMAKRARMLSRPLADIILALDDNAHAANPETLADILGGMPAFRPPLTPEAVGVLMRLGRYFVDAVDFVPGATD